MNQPYVLIIDPFSSGSLFAGRVKSLYGFDCIALITNTALPESVASTFRRDDYLETFELLSIEETATNIERVMGGRPAYLICGSEPGVLIFDQLAVRWNLRPNEASSTLARRDKYLMQEQLEVRNVPCIPHFKSDCLSKVLSWRRQQNFTHCVIKPIRSFGTDGVYFCETEQELTNAFDKLIGTTDYSGNLNSEVLVERKLEGTEYVVDAVSCNGEHHIVNMFSYVKENINNAPLYRQMTTVQISDHPHLVEYTKRSLSALGIRHGPSHSELIMTSEGPVLVETGARMHGGLGPRIVEECNSHSLIDLAIHSRISEANFTRETRATPTLRKFATEYFLVAPAAGLVQANNIERLCSKLESFHFTTCTLSHGDAVPKTTDLITSCGRVVLCNADRVKLERDVEELRALETSGALLKISPQG